MECPKCGAALPPGAECPCADAGPDSAADVAASPAEAAQEPPKRPFAEITPYSGPYPPPYVQVSSSASQPGPVNILSKWIGLLWSAVIPICIFVGANSAGTDRLSETEAGFGANVSPLVWFGLWAVVAVPAFLLYRATRPRDPEGLRRPRR